MPRSRRRGSNAGRRSRRPRPQEALRRPARVRRALAGVLQIRGLQPVNRPALRFVGRSGAAQREIGHGDVGGGALDYHSKASELQHRALNKYLLRRGAKLGC